MIRGFFDPETARPVPKVRVGLFLPGISRTVARVDLLIDTGAMVTSLSPLDATRSVGIDPSKLEDLLPYATPQRVRGIGGEISTFATPAVYGFVHDDGAVQIVNGQIVMIPLSDANARLPSLLGWDLLQLFQLTAN